ncbi:MAG: NrtA/SsuA/CpmA family ABC transporter substrate-binding protein [Chromatiales bacterium]|jgi:ABC-type nitrate/sulfonate/bicarbonate transport system substrate-binding protein
MSWHKKPITVVTFISAAILAVVLLLWPEGQRDRAPDAQKHITLGLPMQPTSALAIIAMDQGFFAENGLLIEIKPFPSGKRALQEGLLPGEVDIAISSDIPIMLQAFKDKQLRILSALGATSDVNAIVARRDRGITVPADLKGKRIATQKASAVHYFLHLFLRKHSISEQNVHSSFLKAEQLPKALADGTIDAFSMREPYIGEALKLLGDQAVNFSAPGIYPQTDMVVTHRQFIQNNPKVIRGLIQALLAAERFANEKPEQAADILARRLGADRKLIAELWPKLDLSVSLHQPLVLLLESQARWALREELVNGNEIPDYTSHMHLDTLRDLKPEAVAVIP